MYKRSISNMKKIRNKHIQGYLEENGIYPVREDCEGVYYYKRSSELSLLLDRYAI